MSWHDGRGDLMSDLWAQAKGDKLRELEGRAHDVQMLKFGQVIIIIIIIYYYTKHDVKTIERVGVIKIWSSPDETLIIAS